MLHVAVYDIPYSGSFASPGLESEATDVTFSTAITESGIGGCVDASFKVRRPLGDARTELKEENRIVIRDGPYIVFDGRLLEPRRRWEQGRFPVWEVQALGAGKQFSERLHNRVWVETELSSNWFSKSSSALGGDFSTASAIDVAWGYDIANDRLIISAIQHDMGYWTGCYGGWFYELPRPQYTEDYITRLEFGWHLHALSGSWQAQVRTYGASRNYLSTVWSTCLPSDTPGSTAGSVGLNLSGTSVTGLLFAFSLQTSSGGSVIAPNDESSLRIIYKDVRIRTHGDGSASNLYQDQLIKSLIRTTASTEDLRGISEDMSLVSIGSPRDLGQGTVRWLDGKYVSDVIADILKYGDAASLPNPLYLNVWYPGFYGVSPSDGLPIVELTDYTTQNWYIEITPEVVESIEIEASKEIYTRGLVRYKTPQGQPRFTSMLSSSGILTLARRDVHINVDTTASDSAIAVRDRTVSLKDHLRASTVIVLKRPVRTNTGQIVPLSRVRAGLKAKLLGFPNMDESVFLIKSTEYDDATKTVRITPGDPSVQAELALSNTLANMRG